VGSRVGILGVYRDEVSGLSIRRVPDVMDILLIPGDSLLSFSKITDGANFMFVTGSW
jgi:hypothetical protein